MNVLRRLVAIGLLMLASIVAAPPAVTAAEATAESRTVTIGVPDMH